MSITSDECRAKAADWYLAPGEIRNALEAAADALDAANAELANVKMGCAELDRQLNDARARVAALEVERDALRNLIATARYALSKPGGPGPQVALDALRRAKP